MRKLFLFTILIFTATLIFSKETQVNSVSPFRCDMDNFKSVCKRLDAESWQYAVYYTDCGNDTLHSIALLNYLYGKSIGFLEFFFDEDNDLYCVRFTNQVTRQTIYDCNERVFLENKERHYEKISQNWNQFITTLN